MTKDEALRLALEALEANLGNWAAKTKAIPIIKQALEQPEHQPKADIATLPEPVGRFAKFSSGVWKEVTDGSAGQPLYASPPQRQWVGLTDEEIETIYADCSAWDKFEYERMLEAKLKQKNGYTKENT